jgi:hypothetical protein
MGSMTEVDDGEKDCRGERMRHLRQKSTEDIDKTALAMIVRQAVILNIQKGDPTNSE